MHRLVRNLCTGLVGLAMLTGLLAGCEAQGGTDGLGLQQIGGGQVQLQAGKLFVADAGTLGGDSVLRFDDAATVNGNVAAEAQLNNSLVEPVSLHINAFNATNVLAVVDSNNAAPAVAFFDNGATVASGTAPSRRIIGANTGLIDPTAVVIDGSAGRVWVLAGNVGGVGRLLRFDGFHQNPGQNGDINQAPTRTITDTALLNAVDIALDELQDRLYVLSSDGRVVIYDNAGDLNNDVSLVGEPNRIVINDASLIGATAIAVDFLGNQSLYVGNTTAAGGAGRVFAFDNPIAITTAGQGVISRTINIRADSLASDGNSDRLFASDSGTAAVQVFEFASQLTGAAVPTRTVSGAATLLVNPVGLAVDPIR